MFGLLQRRSFFVGTLAAAVGVPYVLNEPDLRGKIDGLLGSFSAPADSTDPAHSSGPLATQTVQHLGGAGPIAHDTMPPNLQSFTDRHQLPSALTGPPVQDFAEILRFDIAPQWVLSRWSRVTTVLSEYDLEGLRVPLVSGTRLDDIAGSLTYYYDKQHRLQRIALEGVTGDERRLAQHVQRYFGLKPEPSLYAGLLMAKWNGRPKSALIVRHAPVVTSASPHMRLEVRMEINRPENYYEVSQPFLRELEHGQHSSRW